jgi:hypothetical protein
VVSRPPTAATVHAYDAGVASAFPAASTAATVKECGPAASEPYVCGDPQGAGAPPSRLHLKLATSGLAE